MAIKTNKKNETNMTQISISLRDELVAQIDAMARADNRNRSNFIAHAMKQRVDAVNVNSESETED